MKPIDQSEPNPKETLGDPPQKTGVADIKIASDSLTSTVSKYSLLLSIRPLLLILAPILITALYIVIWRRYMVFEDSDLKFGSGTTDHQWLFYGWFVIGIFGLNWSKDGLSGVEVAMLQRPYWQARDEIALEMHMQNRWSGVAGWFHWIRHVQPKRRLYRHKLLGLLSFISILIFIGLPLSGLTMNISEGFLTSPTHPRVIGRTRMNLYDQNRASSKDFLLESWKIGSFPIVPGYGIIYTPRNVSRSDYETLNRFPNTLPLTESIPEIFLAPQAEYPIAGMPWGLRAEYSCSIVQDISTFTILSQRPSSIWNGVPENPNYRDPNIRNPSGTFTTPTGKSISAFVADPYDGGATNLWGYIEIASDIVMADLPIDPFVDGLRFDKSYNNCKGVFEYMLWQVRLTGSYEETDYRANYKFNDTIEPTIKGAPSPVLQLGNGTWVRNTTFFQANGKDRNSSVNRTVDISLDIGDGKIPFERIVSVPEPIGVRCEFTSAVGTVKLEPETSSFSSFTPEPPKWEEAQKQIGPLGTRISKVMESRGFLDLFSSAGSPAPVQISNSQSYENYLQPQTLLKSIMLAFGLDALSIMYDSANGFEGGWTNENLTSSKRANIITPGVVPPWVPLIFFGPWTLICIFLALFYGFIPRLSDKLDEHSLALLSQDLKDRNDMASNP